MLKCFVSGVFIDLQAQYRQLCYNVMWRWQLSYRAMRLVGTIIVALYVHTGQLEHVQ